MRRRNVVLLLLAGLGSLFLWIMNCSGPRAVVTQVELVSPAVVDEPYRVVAYIENRGRGHGEVGVIFRLRERQNGYTVQSSERVALEAGERSIVTSAIVAPQGTYVPEVELEYPPR